MLQICSEHAVDFSVKKKEEVPEEEEVSEETEEVSTPAPAAETEIIPPLVTPGPTSTSQGMEIDQDQSTQAPATEPTPVVSEEEERKQKEEKQEKEFRKQGIAVVGIALVAMGEEVGAEMALRHFQHLVRFSIPTFLLIPSSLLLSMFIVSVMIVVLDLLILYTGFCRGYQSHDLPPFLSYHLSCLLADFPSTAR